VLSAFRCLGGCWQRNLFYCVRLPRPRNRSITWCQMRRQAQTNEHTTTCPQTLTNTCKAYMQAQINTNTQAHTYTDTQANSTLRSTERGPAPLNFGGQKRSGAFDTVWPSANLKTRDNIGARCDTSAQPRIHTHVCCPLPCVLAQTNRFGTVAILAQGTSWAVAVTQAFLAQARFLSPASSPHRPRVRWADATNVFHWPATYRCELT